MKKCPKCGAKPQWIRMPLAEFILKPSNEWVWAWACSHPEAK